MKNLGCFAILVGLTAWILPANAQGTRLPPTTGNPQLDSLYARNSIEAVRFDDDGYIRSLTGRMAPSDTSGDSVERFYRFLEEYSELFPIDHLRENLRVDETKRSQSSDHGFGLQQYYHGVPVFGSAGGVTVLSDGTFNHIILAYFRDSALNPEPTLKEPDAKARLAAEIKCKLEECAFKEMGLYVYIHEGDPYLVWHTIATCPHGFGDFFLDAHTGTIIERLPIHVH